MMPRKSVMRRAPSLLSRHKDWDFGIPGDTVPRSQCPGQLAMYFTPNARPGLQWAVVVRCEGCGKPIEARGAMFPSGEGWYSEPWVDADPDDCDDNPAWGV